MAVLFVLCPKRMSVALFNLFVVLWPALSPLASRPPGSYPNLPTVRLMAIETVVPAQDEGLRGNEDAKLHLRYGYDAGGNVEALWDAYGKQGQPKSWTYSYDFLDRLTGASGSYAAAYQYTSTGNMTSKTEEGTTYTMAYEDADHVHAPSLVNGQALQYDGNGNMTVRVVDPAQDAGLRGECVRPATPHLTT